MYKLGIFCQPHQEVQVCSGLAESDKSYTQAFKEEAVALVTEQGYSVTDVAASLGIRTNQLYEWKQKQDVAKGDRLLKIEEKKTVFCPALHWWPPLEASPYTQISSSIKINGLAERSVFSHFV